MTSRGPRRVFLLGPPGSGKSTQGRLLADRLGVPHVTAGGLLREAIDAGTPPGLAAAAAVERGSLVPDDVVASVLREGMDPELGFVLDGYPRNESQALAGVDGDPDAVVALRLSDGEVVRRLAGRRVCPEGHLYHVDDAPPRRAGVCDLDGSPLSRRDDDSPEVVERRLRLYEEESEPVIAHFREVGVLTEVDAGGPTEEVAAGVASAVGLPP